MPNKKGKTKTIRAFGIVDWRKGNVRTRQTKPSISELGNNELMAELKFEVKIPEIDIPTLAAEIEVPEPMIHSATLEALDERDLPDWAKVADEKISDHLDRIENASNETEYNIVLNSIVVETIREAPGRPPLDRVEDYVGDLIRSMEIDSAEVA